MKKYQKITIEESDSIKNTVLNSGRLLLAAGGGSALGAVAGMYSIPISVLLAGYGVHKGNMDAVAAGVGMFTGGAYKSVSSISGLDGPEDVYGIEDGMNGFNISDLFSGAKERLKNWFQINKARVSMRPVMPPMQASSTTKQGKVGNIDDMTGFGNPQYLTGFGNPQYLEGNTEELIGETTEMTIASIGDVRADPASGSMLLGMDSMGRIL